MHCTCKKNGMFSPRIVEGMILEGLVGAWPVIRFCPLACVCVCVCVSVCVCVCECVCVCVCVCE